MSQILTPEKARAKAVTRDLIKMAGGVERAAQNCRVCKSAIGNYSNVERMEDFMPADVIIDLEHDVGSPVLTRELALIAGYVLMPIIKVPASCGFGVHLAKVLSETGDVISSASKAFEDGKLTIREKRELGKQISEAIGALANAAAFLEEGLD